MLYQCRCIPRCIPASASLVGGGRLDGLALSDRRFLCLAWTVVGRHPSISIGGWLGLLRHILVSTSLDRCHRLRSRIRRQSFGLPLFGMTPNGLVCTSWLVSLSRAMTLPSSHSVSRYLVTTWGNCDADLMFFLTGRQQWLLYSKPILNPRWIPSRI